MVAGRLFSKGDVITSKSLGTLSGIVRSGALTALPVGLEADSSAGIPLDFDEPAPGATSYSLKRGPE